MHQQHLDNLRQPHCDVSHMHVLISCGTIYFVETQQIYIPHSLMVCGRCLVGERMTGISFNQQISHNAIPIL